MVEDSHTAGSHLANLLQPLRGVGQRVAEFFAPSADASETKQSYEIEVELPGVSPEDINVDIQGNTLVLSGEKRWSREESGKSYFFSERAYGSFSRTFRLPPDFDESKISADFKDGVLSVSIPKRRESVEGKRKISVRHG